MDCVDCMKSPWHGPLYQCLIKTCIIDYVMGGMCMDVCASVCAQGCVYIVVCALCVCNVCWKFTGFHSFCLLVVQTGFERW